jgi:hypothetical protein
MFIRSPVDALFQPELPGQNQDDRIRRKDLSPQPLWSEEHPLFTVDVMPYGAVSHAPYVRLTPPDWATHVNMRAEEAALLAGSLQGAVQFIAQRT